MELTEILKEVRKIEIKTRGLSRNVFAGQYHSAFKGRGMAFSEVREYQLGDDIRTIDWNVTARFNHPFVKVFEEERELTMMLLIDVSQSGMFGSKEEFKNIFAAKIAGVIAYSALQNNDKIGVIFFSDIIEKFIPPQKGRKHVLRILREIIDFKSKNTGTNVSEALRYLTNVIKKRSTAFVISDFMDQNFSNPLRVANKKHDVIALHVLDERELAMPNMGLVQFFDPETNTHQWIDTSSRANRKAYEMKMLAHMNHTKDIFMRAGVDFSLFYTHKDFVRPLLSIFEKRNSR